MINSVIWLLWIHLTVFNGSEWEEVGLIFPAIQAKGSTEEMLWGVGCVLAQSLNAHQKKGISADLSSTSW